MSWTGLVNAAVMGTGRTAVPAAELLGAAQLEPADDQTRLLHTAAVMSRARRAGYRPREAGERRAPVPADEDCRPQVSQAAERRLADLLSSGQHELIAEWLRLLAEREPALRPPDLLLPALLTAAAGRPELRACLLPILGPLAGWLGSFNAEWAWARDAGPGVASESAEATELLWETGGIDDRRALLGRMRAADPATGRRLVASTWATDPYQDRAAFVGMLATGLSLDDEPLAEQALADRRAEVRRAAADLLARLPGSRYSQRATARVAGAVRVERTALRTRLALTVPDALTPDMTSDGMDGAPPRGVGAQAWLLRQVVAAAPAGFWASHTGLGPAELLALADRADWSDPLRAGWTSAAIRDADSGWLLALLDWPADDRRAEPDPRLFAALPLAALDEWLSANPGSRLLAPALERLPVPWSARLSDRVRAELATIAQADPGYSPRPRALFRLAALRLEPPAPPDLDPARVHDRLRASWNDLRSKLSVRAAIRRELAEEPKP